jgi:hypothetical protein
VKVAKKRKEEQIIIQNKKECISKYPTDIINKDVKNNFMKE